MPAAMWMCWSAWQAQAVPVSYTHLAVYKRQLKGSLMNLAMTNEAGAVYNNYLTNYMNEDGSINWLPVCADAHGFVVNRGLFEKYDIPLPTDYDSFVSALSLIHISPCGGAALLLK